MELIFTNIIMQHASHFKWLHRHLSVAQGPSHCHHGDSRTSLWHRHNRAQWKSVTLQLHPNFHSVSVMFLEWNCLSGLAPLKPFIVLGPVRGWPAGLTCHSSWLTHSPKPHISKTANRISLRGCSHLVSSFLIGSGGWLLWQWCISSLLEVALTNHNMSVHLTVSAHLTCTNTPMSLHVYPCGDLLLIWLDMIPLHPLNLKPLPFTFPLVLGGKKNLTYSCHTPKVSQWL